MKAYNEIPTPKEKHWLFGNAILMKNEPVKVLRKFIAENGGMLRLTLPFRRVVVITKPDSLRSILLENNKLYRKSMAYDMLKLLLGNGLLTSEGDFWKKQRRLIQPAFGKKKLEELTLVMVAETEKSVARLQNAAEKNDIVDILAEMNALTLDIISKSMFSSGVEDKAQIVGEEITRLNNYAVDKINSPFPIPHWIPTPLNRKERKSLDTLDKVIFEIINTRRKSKEQKDDLLSMLLDVQDEDTGERMSDQQLRDEVMTIFIAGNETSSNALTWTLYLLSQNPDIEKRFVQEIKERFTDKPITTQNIMEFHYSRMILEESMRLYPPAWIVGRRPLEDVEIEGYQIPKDTNILMPVFYLHKSPLYWQEPDKFDPERFAPETRNNIDRFVYLPFGGGPRMCIGNHFAMLEMQIVITMLYSRFTFEMQKDFAVELDPLITLRPKNGLMMKVTKRKD